MPTVADQTITIRLSHISKPVHITHELEDILVSVFEEYNEREEDKILREQIEKNGTITSHIHRIR
jgi:hypothetical protein